MEFLKDLKPVLDLGVTGIVLVGALYMVIRPPKWIQTTVDAHHQLALGVKMLGTAVAAMPKREEIQELLIGQEALRRETEQTREELRGLHKDVIVLGDRIHGFRG